MYYPLDRSPSFTTKADMVAHYVAVRKRLNTKPAPLPVRPIANIIAEAEDVRATAHQKARAERAPYISSVLNRDWLLIATPENKNRLSLVQIRNVTFQYFDLDPVFYTTKRRAQHLVRARHIFYWLARELNDKSFPIIAQFAQRDPSTVLHGAKKVQRLLPQYAEDIAEITRVLEVLV